MDKSRLQQLAGIPINEASTIAAYDEANRKAQDSKHIAQLVDQAIERLSDRGEEIDPDNIIEYLKNNYTDISAAEINAVRRQLADESDTSPTG